MRGGTKGHQERRGSATRCEEMRGDKRSLDVILRDTRSKMLALGHVVQVHIVSTEAPRHRKGSEEVKRGYQEMRGSAGRCEEMRGDTRRCEVIRGDTRRCEEVRGWLRGMAFRFKILQASLAVLWQRSLWSPRQSPGHWQSFNGCWICRVDASDLRGDFGAVASTRRI